LYLPPTSPNTPRSSTLPHHETAHSPKPYPPRRPATEGGEVVVALSHGGTAIWKAMCRVEAPLPTNWSTSSSSNEPGWLSGGPSGNRPDALSPGSIPFEGGLLQHTHTLKHYTDIRWEASGLAPTLDCRYSAVAGRQ